MGELANCPRCGDLFVKATKSICHKCVKEEEADFQKVYEYIRKKENRSASIPEVSDATEVSEDLIIKFVKERRLRATQFPGIAYPCQKCGKKITEGVLCKSCSNELSTDLRRDADVKNLQARNSQSSTQGDHTYYSVEDKINRKG